MKYQVTAITTTDFAITIPDDLITDELISEFSEYMWKIDSRDELIAYIMRMFAAYPDITFIEGVGDASLFKVDTNWYDSETEIESMYPIVED